MTEKLTSAQRVEQLSTNFDNFLVEEKEHHTAINSRLDAIDRSLQDLNLTDAARQHLFGHIPMMHRTLYGDPEKNTPGLTKRIDDLEKLSASITRLTWIVVGELVGLIGAGLTWLVFGR